MSSLREKRKFKEFMQNNPSLDYDKEFTKAVADIECEECGTYDNVYACDGTPDWFMFLCKDCLDKYPNKELPEPQTNSKTLHMRFAVFMRDGFRCVYCGRTIEDGVKLEVDHVYPKSKGGKDTMENLVTSCWECNHGKGDLIINFRRSQGK